VVAAGALIVLALGTDYLGARLRVTFGRAVRTRPA
jgi:hypothetical protein